MDPIVGIDVTTSSVRFLVIEQYETQGIHGVEFIGTENACVLNADLTHQWLQCMSTIKTLSHGGRGVFFFSWPLRGYSSTVRHAIEKSSVESILACAGE